VRRIVTLMLVAGGLGCTVHPPAPFSKTMNPLHIALHDGFQQNTVKVTVDGREVYNKQGVSTNVTLSRADAFDTQASSNTARVDVSVEPGGYKGSIQIDVTQNPYLAVSLGPDGKLSFKPSKELFRYM